MTYTMLYLILTILALMCAAALFMSAHLYNQLRRTRSLLNHLHHNLAFSNSSLCRLETKLDGIIGTLERGDNRNEDDLR